MYRVLIVDDERIIRLGMKKAVDWEWAGVDQVLTAGSGEEALEILSGQDIQILITDILMGTMSGLELIGIVKKRYPDIRIIVLTGFDEFDYAHKCLKMKVEDFLLKPVDEEHMANLVKKQIDELKQEEQQRKMAGVIRRVTGSLEQIQLNKLMCQLLTHSGDIAAIVSELCKKYQYQPGQRMQAAVFFPRITDEDKKEEEAYLRLAIKDFCNNNIDLRERGITFEDGNGRMVIAWFLDEDNEDCSSEIQELILLLKDEFGISQKIVLGSTVNGFRQFRISYNDALLLMEKERQSYREIIQDRKKQDANQMFWEVFGEIKNAIAANQGNDIMVMRIFETFCQMTESYRMSTEHVRRCCFELASAVYFSYVANNSEVKGDGMQSFTNAILSARTEEALDITRAFIEGMQHTEEESNHKLIEQAKEYIRDHLSEELSVTGIAQMLFLTPSYFSRLFKKVAQEGCNDYIVRLRMEKAEYLLESTNMKTGEIANKVGYQDKNYFSLAFKKHSGMSPTIYREKIRS